MYSSDPVLLRSPSVPDKSLPVHDLPRTSLMLPQRTVILQRAVIAAAALGLVEWLFTCETGHVAVRMMPAVFAADATLIFVLAACWLASTRLVPGVPPGLLETSGFLLLLLGPVVAFSLRGDTMTPTSPLLRPWVPWFRWGGGGVISASIVAFAYLNRRERVSHARFFLAAFLTFFFLVLEVAARTVESASQWQSVDVAELCLGVLAFGCLGFFVLYRSINSWHRTALLVLVACAVSLVVGARRNPTIALRTVEARPRNAMRASGRPIILITIDTLRRDHLSVYGYPRDTTPNLRRLADRSLVFDHAYASAPYTLSSHASLFTGRLPSEHGAHRLPAAAAFSPPDAPLSPAVRTLAEELSSRGYLTAGIAANYGYLATWTGLSRGFDAYFAEPKHALGYYPLLEPLVAKLQNEVPRTRLREAWPAEAVTNTAIRWLAANRSEPIFLFLNYLDVHEYHGHLDKRNAPTFVNPGQLQRSGLIASYDDQLQVVDREIGRLLEWLEAAPEFHDAVIVVTSDHGEYLGEHGLWLHGHDLHEPVLRIPLIVRLPEMTQGERVDVRLTHQDIFSLLLGSAAGSERQVISGLRQSQARVIAESWTAPTLRSRYPGRFTWRAARAIYQDDWKLIQRLGAPNELYDLKKDPDETRDIVRSDPDGSQQVVTRLISGLPSLEGDRVPKRTEPSADSLERLKGLGYLGL
jgi:arylsulfatase A-like enzyme